MKYDCIIVNNVCGTKYICGTNDGKDPYGKLNKKKIKIDTTTPRNKNTFQCCDLITF